MDLEQLQDFFLWCSLINFGLLTFSALLVMIMKNTIARMHGRMFKLDEGKVMQILYMIIGIYKVLVFVLNVVPLIALHIID